jgi:hypothetical protein
MNIKVLDDFPSNNVLKKLIPIFLVLFFITVYIVNTSFETSGYPVSFVESQLSFSGEQIKSHFQQMNPEQIELYRTAQIIDYSYMVVYGTFIFLLLIFIGRRFKNNMRLRTISYVIAIGGIIAASCDAIENIFIFLMINDPVGFPNIFAITHSCFALIKFVLMFVALIWIVLSIPLKRIYDK